MGRDIRFRVWDVAHSQMITVDKMTFSESVQWSNCAVCGFHYGPNAKDYPLMQFTGLYDRKGEDIFEGDILADWKGKYQVVWSEEDARWGIATTLGRICDPLVRWNKEGEVIGNIYEHPHLLEAK